jgi:hypothetical protein
MMEAIKSKIFDVLTNRISITQFENWLYDSEEILENLKEDSLYFDVVTINYKSKSWRTDLKAITLNKFTFEFTEIVKIEESCTLIVNAKTAEEIYNVISKLVKDFNFETDYSILWEFLRLKDYFDLVKEGLISVGNLEKQSRFYASKTLKIVSNGEDFESIKKDLEQSLEEFTYENKF